MTPVSMETHKPMKTLIGAGYNPKKLRLRWHYFTRMSDK